MALCLLKEIRMLDVAISVVALLAGGLILEVFAAAKAPSGYQDKPAFQRSAAGKNTAGAETENPN